MWMGVWMLCRQVWTGRPQPLSGLPKAALPPPGCSFTPALLSDGRAWRPPDPLVPLGRSDHMCVAWDAALLRVGTPWAGALASKFLVTPDSCPSRGCVAQPAPPGPNSLGGGDLGATPSQFP